MTDFAQTFSEVYLPLILQFFITAGAVVSVVYAILKPILKARNMFSGASGDIKKLIEENAELRKAAETTEKAFTQENARRTAEVDALKTELTTLVGTLNSEVKTLYGLVSKDIEVNKIACLNDPYLVANGYAQKIGKILEGDINENQEAEKAAETND